MLELWLPLGIGALYVVLGLPLMLGMVPRNDLYGFRTEKTFSDPAIWYAANRASGRALVIAGLAIAILARVVVDALDGLVPPPLLLIVNVGVLAAATALAVGYSVRVLRRL